MMNKMQALSKARRLARRFGGWPIEYYYALVRKYSLS